MNNYTSAVANTIIRTNIDYHKIDRRMHSYELIRASVFTPLSVYISVVLLLVIQVFVGCSN